MEETGGKGYCVGTYSNGIWGRSLRIERKGGSRENSRKIYKVLGIEYEIPGEYEIPLGEDQSWKKSMEFRKEEEGRERK